LFRSWPGCPSAASTPITRSSGRALTVALQYPSAPAACQGPVYRCLGQRSGPCANRGAARAALLIVKRRSGPDVALARHEIASAVAYVEKKGSPSTGEPPGSACGIRTRDLRLERAVSLATRRTRHERRGASRVCRCSPPWAAGLGFEPRLTDPESAVLPLDDP